MSMSSSNNDKKNLNFELNLLPVFDILSVCICFLLMTVVWVQVSALKTSQAIGGQPQAETKSPPSVWVTLNTANDIEVSFQNTPKPLGHQRLKAHDNRIAWQELESLVAGLKKRASFQIALVMPAKTTSYADVIRIMDGFKRSGISDVGLSPL